ncbi:MAG: hypothetical protein ACRC5A_09615, partial [Enterobacteriaceae bacterium]
AVVVLVVLANDHLIMITAHFPLFFLKIRHFFYRYQLVDPKDPTYNAVISASVLPLSLRFALSLFRTRERGYSCNIYVIQ